MFLEFTLLWNHYNNNEPTVNWRERSLLKFVKRLNEGRYLLRTRLCVFVEGELVCVNIAC
jgi:hypothetical protein